MHHNFNNDSKKYTEDDYIFWDEFYIPDSGDIDDFIFSQQEYKGPSQR